jgi:hypothetical protein
MSRALRLLAVAFDRRDIVDARLVGDRAEVVPVHPNHAGQAQVAGNPVADLLDLVAAELAVALAGRGELGVEFRLRGRIRLDHDLGRAVAFDEPRNLGDFLLSLRRQHVVGARVVHVAIVVGHVVAAEEQEAGGADGWGGVGRGGDLRRGRKRRSHRHGNHGGDGHADRARAHRFAQAPSRSMSRAQSSTSSWVMVA